MKHKLTKTIRIRSLILFLLYAGCIVSDAQETPRTYIALKTGETLNIDGEAKESSWTNAEWSANFIDIEGTIKPKYKTQMKMLWNDTYLYFFAKMEEPHVWATLKQRDTVIFYNNDFEIFIDPDGDTHNYMEFEMNALNTIWDLFLTKPYRNHGKVLDSWDIQGIKTAVHIDGTMNKSDDFDKGWSIEIAMPWSVLIEASNSNTPPENEFWRINFSRVNWQHDLTDGRYSRKKSENGRFLPEYNWVWSPQGVINMHEPEHWGYVYFTKKQKGSDSFEIPKDDHIKRYLYELYRGMLNEKKRKTNYTAADGQIFGHSKMILGKNIVPSLENHKDGFVIWAKSPFTEKTLMIKEDGKFFVQ